MEAAAHRSPARGWRCARCYVSMAPTSTPPAWPPGVAIVPAGRLRSLLTAAPPLLSQADVAGLAAYAHTMLRPA